MNRKDVFGIVFGAMALLVIMFAVASKRKLQGNRTECPIHLKEIYVAYETALSDLGQPPGLLEKYIFESQWPSQRPAAATVFKLLGSNGLALVSAVCPLDTRRVAADVQALENTNLSYFISTRSNSGDPN